jgi:thioesterase domain-containing protein/acyl carrier protein
MSELSPKTEKSSIPFGIEDTPIYQSVLPIVENSAGLIDVARDDIEQHLTVIWEKLLAVKSIGIEDDFFELGGDSMAALQLFDDIEGIWGQNLPLATLFENQTIKKLATVLRQKECVAPWSSLVCIQMGDDYLPPLFCIHPVGGNVLEYHTLANYLDKKQTIYGLQSQGLDGRAAPLQSVEEMAQYYIEELQTVQPQGPYLLVGYSFGGLIAYEIARRLVNVGQTVALLALLDSSAPELPSLRPSLWQAVGIHLQNLWYLEWQERFSYVGDRFIYRFKSRDEKDFLANSLYKLDDLTPQLVNVLNANLDAREKYTAKKYPGKVNLFRCRIQELKHALHPESGWQRLVDDLEIHPIAGAHFSILKEPRIQSIAQKLKSCLQITQENIIGGVSPASIQKT